MAIMTRVVAGQRQNEAATSFGSENIAAYEQRKGYRDMGVVWVMPSRGLIPTSVFVSLFALQWPMNQFRTNALVAESMEVGAAYNTLVSMVLDRKQLIETFGQEYGEAAHRAPFILTTEEDNLPPWDAVLKLFAGIYKCPDCGAEVGTTKEALARWECAKGHRGFDAVSGLYFVKTDPPIPQAWGQPKKRSKKFDFAPVSVANAIEKGATIEVNGIGMGCALWRKDIFRKLPNTEANPWFETPVGGTQDLRFCKRAKIEAGARFGVDCSIHVGHLNTTTMQMY
jgi:hypothetical protein